MIRFGYWILGFGIFFSACGSLENRSLGGPEGSANPGTELVFLFGTDFVSSGQLYQADPSTLATLENSGVEGLGSSAIIRLFDGLLYILHDGFSVGSSDNVQIIDPTDGYRTLHQWSTGNGTNPRDIAVVDNRATITLYNPSADDENVDENGDPADLIVMNLDTGEIEKRIGFFNFLNDDGERLAHAQNLLLGENVLYVALQDSESDFSLNAPGKIAVINLADQTVDQVISLKGQNPVGLALSEAENKLFVAQQAPFDATLGNFDTGTGFGGLEIVPLDDPDSSILFDDAGLGGYVERVVVAANRVFAVVSEMDPVIFTFTSDIVSMGTENDLMEGVSTFLSGSSDVRDISLDSQDRLWISRRSISVSDGLASDPKVDVFETENGNQVESPLIPDVPVTSIAIGEI